MLLVLADIHSKPHTPPSRLTYGLIPAHLSHTRTSPHPSLCTLASNFQYPLLRDFIMSLGSVPVSRKSIEYILGSGPGNSVAIVVGGGVCVRARVVVCLRA